MPSRNISTPSGERPVRLSDSSGCGEFVISLHGLRARCILARRLPRLRRQRGADHAGRLPLHVRLAGLSSGSPTVRWQRAGGEAPAEPRAVSLSASPVVSSRWLRPGLSRGCCGRHWWAGNGPRCAATLSRWAQLVWSGSADCVVPA